MYYRAMGEPPMNLVRAEILVRPSYEYTPPPVESGGAYQQVTVDANEAIGNEIRILSKTALFERTLADVPKPATAMASDAQEPAAPQTAAELMDSLGVKQIEGSTVVEVSMIVDDPDWGTRFLTRLLEDYVSERKEVFSRDAYTARLAEQLEALDDDRDEMQTNIVGLSTTIANDFALWSQNLQTLQANPGRADDVRSLEARFAARLLQLDAPGGFMRLSELSLGDDRLSQAASELDEPSVEEMLAIIDRMFFRAVRRETLTNALAILDQKIGSLEDASLRNDLRLAASEPIIVLSQPYVDPKTVGWPPLGQALLVALLALTTLSVLTIAANGARES